MARGGKRVGAGKKPGSQNKLTSELRFDLLESLRNNDFEPAHALVQIHNEAMQLYRDKIKDQNGWGAGPALDTARNAAATLMEYVYPKRKSVELTGQDGKDLFQSFADLAKQVVNAK